MLHLRSTDDIVPVGQAIFLASPETASAEERRLAQCPLWGATHSLAEKQKPTVLQSTACPEAPRSGAKGYCANI